MDLQKSQQMSHSGARQELLKIAEANSWPDSDLDLIKNSPDTDIDEVAEEIVSKYDGTYIPAQVFTMLLSDNDSTPIPDYPV